MLRRIPVEKLTIIRDPKALALSFDSQHVRQAQIAKLEMMPVSLAVRRDVHHRLPGRCRLDHPHQAFTRRQRLLKRDRPRQWTIVKEQSNRSATAISMKIAVRATRIDRAIVNIGPSLITKRAITRRLRRRKNHIPQTLLDQHVERRIVDRSL